MEKYGVNQLRQMFLDYFESKGHLIMKSFSLVPHNDKSLLLINAGMAPLKPYFTGAEVPPRTRVATCQKCIRTGDIENVGKTARHGTFFEMLGNFSFGDYFKNEALEWTWEFLTKVVGLDPDRLYPSVYLDDDEAYEIWNKKIGVPAERIYRFGKEDNFWEHGAGPCGPCSEVYYDRGEKYGCGKPDCAPGCDCDRYMEIWNDVFTQFENDGKGNYETLKQKNIDTGMGLERLAVAVQDVDSMFDIDTIRALRDRICEVAGKTYHADADDDVSIRVITDHIRSATFMISDGILPSNEGRGYVLRRLIRRAARHGRRLGIGGYFLADLAATVAQTSADGYPELSEKLDFIRNILSKEEETFGRTIDQGLKILSDLEEEMASSGQKVLSGQKAFVLYDTYGFPIDLTRDILQEKGLGVDEEAFAACMQQQRERARAARKVQNYMGAEATVYDEIDREVTSVFTGYEGTVSESIIRVVTTKVDADHYGELTDALGDGEEGTLILDETPFYATKGGQVGDTGVITTAQGEFAVTDTIQLRGGRIGHVGHVTGGVIMKGAGCTATVDAGSRRNIEKNHSATHLLQKALKIVLGNHVEQKGSLVEPSRLRFDFTHFQAMTDEELARTEQIVNDQINAALDVKTDVMSLDEAKKTGAMALFDDKYGEKVRVVSMGDFSKELCGGTHVSNTAKIKLFKILSEQGISSGVRRIEAVTGDGVLTYYRTLESELNQAAAMLKAGHGDICRKISQLQGEVKSLMSENESLKSRMAREALGNAGEEAVDVKGVKLIAANVDNVDMSGLRELGDQLKEKLGEGVVVLASAKDGKVSLMVSCSEEAQKKGAHAGNLIRSIAPLVGGGGGGRPGMAQAGGKNPAGIPKALEEAKKILESLIG